MRFTNLIASASLLGAAAIAAPAGPVGHQHKEKRAVATKTVHTQVTVVVTANADGTLKTATPVAAASNNEKVQAVDESIVLGSQNSNEQTPAVVTTTVNNAASKPASTNAASKPAVTSKAASKAAATSKAASKAATSTKAASTKAAATSSSSDAGFSASAKGICYTPYTSSGACKSASEVASDLASLKDYSTIRLYGTDCDQVANVMKAKGSNQKLFVGIYDVSDIQGSVDTIKAAIEAYGSWSDVTTVSVGNELVNSGQATPDQIGGYVSSARSALTSAGYSGPVVAVDTFIAVINNPQLCQYSDYMAVNAHAYFDQNTAAQDAGPWVLQQIQRVATACGNSKTVEIVETGWPSQGQTLGVAVPSAQNQKDAIESIENTCGNDVFLYTAFNDLWKADGAYGVEKYFGIYD